MRSSGLLLACVLAAQPAEAGMRFFEYRAVVGGVATPFASIASEGTEVFGRIGFDAQALDVDPDPGVGRYPGATHEVVVGSYAGVSTQSVVRIVDDGSLPVVDLFEVVDEAPADELDAIGGVAPSELAVVIQASSDLYTGDALPARPPSLDDARVSDAFVRLDVVPPGGERTPLFAQLQTLPEPATGARAALLALLALGARARPRD